MRLTKIKLAGFKSFVDPTTVPITSNLTGVVGPNGCGKSNVIDAVRWVMGESSAKHLRGDSMSDVIFNGSSARKPVSQASIELVFDNTDGAVGGQYAHYNEISIRRVVTRDGQSSYFLNGTRCRRRDITDIFLGTGLGPRSYAIIEQGTISRLIEAKPDELRVFLEEAAGISKYKERRRETENRIRRTRENLDRLEDLREELDKQLNHLQRQARTAERYKEFKAEERELKGQLQALRWQRLDREVHEREGLIREQATGLEAQLAHQRSAESEMEQLRELHVEATEQFNKIQSEYYGIGADIARLEQSIQHTRERRQQQERDLAQVERNWNEAQQHQEEDRRKIEELTRLLDEQGPADEQARSAEERSSTALAEAEAAMNAWQSRWDEFTQKASEPQQSAQVERARMEQLERQTEQYRQRLRRFEEEQAALAGISVDEEIAVLQEEVAELEMRGAALQERLDASAGRIGEQRQANHDAAAELDNLRTQLQSQRGRHASLEALQQGALGKREGAVSEWLQQQGLAEAQRFAEGVEVVAGWERAAETVLGFHLEAVCVDGLDPVSAALGELEHGSLALFDTTNSAAGTATAHGVPLAGKVRSSWAIAGLVDGVYVAEDLNEALALRPRLAAHESVVTADGIWIGPGWLRVARDADEKAGVLQREQELRELAEEIDVLEQQVETVKERLERGNDQLKHLEEEREDAQRRVNDTNKEVGDKHSQLSAKQARAEQLGQRRERLDADAAEVKRQIEDGEVELAAARERLTVALEEMEEFAIRREELSAQREELRERLEQTREQARSDREQAQEITIRVSSARSELGTTEQALQRMEQQLAQLAERREELERALAEGDAPGTAMAEELDERLEQRSAVENRLGEARRKVGEIDHKLRELERERSQAERQVSDIRGRVEQAKMAWQELQVRRQTLKEQLDESGLVLEELIEQMPENAEEKGWEQRLEELGQRIQRLGPINLAAIEEYEQQSERKTYLDSQHDDLMEALETLENAIRKIDRETRTRFKETFDRVNAGLQEKFPRLFGGGHAYLDLTGDDLLDTGVAVMARPPGKRNSTIHLLSGGEKALTAVALVFAIFELNPSPFCMLDEVDAPLDEANVGRFCNLVKEMSERVQFIFITHNKATMELSRQLTGVTMQEPGVSRLVAVDVDEAMEMAAV